MANSRTSATGNGPLRIALIYAAVGGLWIWFSDLVLMRIIGRPELTYWLSLAKGLAFVLLTAALLYWLIRREFRSREAAYARLRALVAASPVAIVTLRDGAGGLTSWNAAAEQLFAWDRADSTGSKDLIAGELRALLHGARRGPDGGIDVELTAATGQRVIARVFGSRLGAEAEADWLIVVEDRTARVELEAQLVQAQKMEAVGRLAGGIAHDFNNLITVMLGNTDLALEEAEPGSSLRAELEEIRRSGDRAARLTRQLLLFGRRSTALPQPLDASEVVRGVLSMLERIIGEDVRLRTELADDLAPVLADPGQMEQVIMNLAVNARDAMPVGGALVIETANVELDENYTDTHPDVLPGSYVMLSVGDTGTGMDAQTQARAFEPFFTTKSEGTGTGLGLSTVYGIIKAAGGHIALYSQRGRGTTVKIYLPAQDMRAPRSRAVTSPVPGPARILIADDEAGVRALVARTLRADGHEVIEAGTAAEAIAVAATSEVTLVIIDLDLPDMPGEELIGRLPPLLPDARLLVTSGFTRTLALPDDASIVREFLAKPFTAGELAATVRRILGGEAQGEARH